MTTLRENILHALTDLRTYGASNRTAPDVWARGAISTIERVQLCDIL